MNVLKNKNKTLFLFFQIHKYSWLLNFMYHILTNGCQTLIHQPDHVPGKNISHCIRRSFQSVLSENSAGQLLLLPVSPAGPVPWFWSSWSNFLTRSTGKIRQQHGTINHTKWGRFSCSAVVPRFGDCWFKPMSYHIQSDWSEVSWLLSWIVSSQYKA